MSVKSLRGFFMKTLIRNILRAVLIIIAILILTYVLLYMIGGKLLIVRLSLALNLPDWLLPLLWGWF